jgi:hypothetical protein
LERGARAALALGVSLVLWYYVPSLLLQELVSPPAIFTQGGLFVFALLIGCLSALGYLFEDGPVGFLCGLGSNLATVAFLYLATDGGILSFQSQGVYLTANFQPLLFLLIMPSVLSMVRKVWSAVSKSAGTPSFWVVRG